MIRTKRGLLILLIPLVASGALGQESPCPTRSVLVNVVDQEGRPVQDLRGDNFRAKYRGHPVDILSATLDAQPRRIVLVLDASGSMQEFGLWDAEQNLAADVIRHGFPGSSLALMVFASEIRDKVGFAQGSAALTKELDRLAAEPPAIPVGHRETALYDAIVAALAELDPPRQGDVIFVISDGIDNTSANKPATVERRLLASGVRLFVFLLADARERPQFDGNGPDALRETEVRVRQAVFDGNGPDALREMVERSGGMFSSFAGAGDLWWRRLSKQELATVLTAARLMYPVMERSYRLEIRVPPGVDKPRDWSLEVMDGKKKSLLQVLYPRLSPCAAQNP